MINRISHIGVLVNDLEKATEYWTGTFGLKKYAEYETDAEGIKACLLSVSGNAGEMSIELMEPLNKQDMSNPVARRLANSGEGFYHLAVDVADVSASASKLMDMGLNIFHRQAISESSDVRWLLHPKESNGVMVEGI